MMSSSELPVKVRTLKFRPIDPYDLSKLQQEVLEKKLRMFLEPINSFWFEIKLKMVLIIKLN